jgi:hypothetical protein
MLEKCLIATAAYLYRQCFPVDPHIPSSTEHTHTHKHSIRYRAFTTVLPTCSKAPVPSYGAELKVASYDV